MAYRTYDSQYVKYDDPNVQYDGAFTILAPDTLYSNESGTQTGAQEGDHNPSDLTDTTPAFSAQMYPQGENIIEVRIQVSQDPMFPDTDLEWDSGWITLGTDQITPSDTDTTGGARTKDIIYGES